MIVIDPGTYKVHGLNITKNITFQGNGNPREIVFDGEQLSSIILVRNKDVHVTFKNITFINGLTRNFGGAISMETGNVYVDNCIFNGNTALQNTNAGAISNYGTMENRAYLFVNNTLFINNHADHDGGAVTTCYAYSEIYNSIFINNTAKRDGGAVRVSVYGVCDVSNCTFMYNHADEWAGAYYSWASNSRVDNCIFLNNTAGTNGGALMASGNITVTNSIIVNNTAGETGGSLYIQPPMFDETTVIKLNNNIIAGNDAPLGKEIYIIWNQTKHLFTNFNDNDWGDTDPTDPSVIDPDGVTKRSKVTRTIKSDLLDNMDLSPLNEYSDLLEDYFPEGYFSGEPENNQSKVPSNDNKPKNNANKNISQPNNANSTNENLINTNTSVANQETVETQTSKSSYSLTNTTSNVGADDGEKPKVSEITKKERNVSKSSELNYYALILIPVLAILIGFGMRKKRNEE